MADIFPVDTSGIDMANQVFNYYMPDASITGSVNLLDQDNDTAITLTSLKTMDTYLGHTVYVHDIVVGPIKPLPYDSFAFKVYTTSDNGTTWNEVSWSCLDSYHIISAVNSTINGVRLKNNTAGITYTISRLAVYAPEDATHPEEGQKFVIRQGGTPIRTHDFGNVSLESGVYETFEVYNTGSTILSGIRIYEVKDDNNDSNVYYKFSLDSSTWYDHSMTIDEPLYPSSGITFYAMVYAPSDASFGSNTIYFRVLAYDTGTEP